jgi:mevalonate pyrophosphate decarboxylase
MDAGPPVKVLCLESDADRVCAALTPVSRRAFVCRPGAGARIVDTVVQ